MKSKNISLRYTTCKNFLNSENAYISNIICIMSNDMHCKIFGGWREGFSIHKYYTKTTTMYGSRIPKYNNVIDVTFRLRLYLRQVSKPHRVELIITIACLLHTFGSINDKRNSTLFLLLFLIPYWVIS